MKSAPRIIVVATLAAGAWMAPAVPAGAQAYTFTRWVGPRGPGSEDGSAAQARLTPSSIALDGAGRVYVAGGGVVRIVETNGDTRTLAGLAEAGGGSDGSGYAARFASASGIAVDATGVVYVADTTAATIRRIAASGQVTTLAGAAFERGPQDGVGSAARFEGPRDLALAPSGDLYVADGDAVRRVTPLGAVTTIASGVRLLGIVVAPSGEVYGTVAGGIVHVATGGAVTAIAGGIAAPMGIAIDGNGDFIVADFGQHQIRRATLGGVVTTIAGSASQGTEDGGPGIGRLRAPRDVLVEPSGDILVADVGNGALRRLDPSGVLSTWVGAAAGAGRPYPPFRRAPVISATANGELDVLQTGGVFHVDLAGNVSLLAGQGPGCPSLDGTGPGARFCLPQGMARTAAGDLLVAEHPSGLLRRIDPGAAVTTVASGLIAAEHVAASPSGDAIVSDGNSFQRVTPAGVVTSFPPTPLRGGGGFAVDAQDNRIVPDVTRACILSLTPGGQSTLVAGTCDAPWWADGPLATARLLMPWGLAGGTASDLFFVDAYTVRRLAGGAVTTVAGEPWAPADVDGTGRHARVRPYALAVDGAGTVYLSLEDGIMRGIPALADAATIDSPSGGVGIARQLDAQPRTATAWRWSVTRRPAGSTAQLSSTAVPDPRFTPDVADLYVFRLEAESPAGTSISTVELHAGCPVTLTALPADRTVCAGSTVVLTGAASGSPAPSYQWQDRFGALIGADSPTLVLADVTEADSGVYVLAATNGCGGATSPPIRVTVAPAGNLAKASSLKLAKAGSEVIASWTPDPAAWTYEVYADAQPVVPFPDLVATSVLPPVRFTPPAAAVGYFRVAGANFCGTGAM